MSKKAILALIIAILIPIVGYLSLKIMSDKAVIMPRKYFIDDVITSQKDGRTSTDTIWHKTKNFTLVNQLGDTVHLYDIKGKAIVFDLFFTRCGSICPKLTKNMAKLQQSFITGGNAMQKIDTSVVQFISLSIDPEHDSVSVLKNYADKFGVNPDNWWMLTGNRDSIYDFIFNELKIDKLTKEPVTPEFPHTSRFVLLDKEYIVRGRMEQPYSGLDSTSLSVLARDIGLLMLEKDKTQKSELLIQILNLKWLWVIIAVIIIAFVVMMFMPLKKKIN
ncbi:MAG: SCO family protein [Bacteroidetes bacterium]|nr:SCO family protein [Bacteroidota bacterium]MBS1648927.1 SCO family protein [Bacteroidota bacterium]